MATKILKKLTLKNVLGSKSDMLAIADLGRMVTKDANGKDVRSSTGVAVKAVQIIGQVTSFTAGESDHGAYLKLKGDFEAVNLLTGEIISDVSTAILPNFISDLVANAMSSGAESVDFAIVISLRYEETAATMYVFEAESLMPVQQSKRISAIRAQLEASGVALPKPAQLKLGLVSESPKLDSAPASDESKKPVEESKPAVKSVRAR